MHERTMLRWGGTAAILGGVLAVGVNALHPRFSDYSTLEIITEVATNGLWTGVHVGLAVATVLLAIGIAAFTRTLSGDRAATIGEIARWGVVVGAGLGVATGALDGGALRAAAEAWSAAGSAPSGPELAAANVLVAASDAIFSLFVMIFLGLAPLAAGYASTRSAAYPAWLGWGAVVGGAGGAVSGLIQAFTGIGSGTIIAITVFSGLLTVWAIAAGFLMWRREEER
ncbi:MAG TPA: hypothetical protein VGB51_04530 [Actinomycetota bacterium]